MQRKKYVGALVVSFATPSVVSVGSAVSIQPIWEATSRNRSIERPLKLDLANEQGA
jgi:hypothetical protein